MEQRKHTRLPGYDYATPGGYFVTICTREKRNIFGDASIPVGRGPCAPPDETEIAPVGRGPCAPPPDEAEIAPVGRGPCAPPPDEAEIAPVGRGPCAPPNTAWTIANGWLDRIPEKFPNWTIDNHVVMPNHVHILLQAHATDAADHMGSALQDVIGWYKTMTTNACIRAVRAGTMPPFEKAVWQKSFYETVIRGRKHYLATWQYIDNNPAHWAEDEYYSEY